MTQFVMPKLGADMSSGKLLSWRKGVGDKVKRGEIIADVETDKADIEVETFATGMIEKILVKPGETVPIGTPMAIIREEGGPTVAAPAAPAVVTLPPPTAPLGREPAARPIVPRIPGAERIRISPAARKAAEELGIDPRTIKGTGPGSRITLEDVQTAAEARAPKPRAKSAAERYSRMREAIAAAMARSKRDIPHYYLSTTVDMHRAVSWLAQENQKREVEDRLLYGALLLKAVALALTEFPEFNSSWLDGRAVRNSEINIGVAISLRQGGLIAPALLNVDRLSLTELMRGLTDLVRRARAGSLRNRELSDSTITVTNLGEQGVDSVFGIIYPPQVALVGFGKLVERPWVIDGRIAARPLISATLSADHRVSDGRRGGLFLSHIAHLLQEPRKL